MNDIKLTDGGLGTELRYRGVEVPSHVNSIWSAQAIIDAPNEIEKIQYLRELKFKKDLKT